MHAANDVMLYTVRLYFFFSMPHVACNIRSAYIVQPTVSAVCGSGELFVDWPKSWMVGRLNGIVRRRERYMSDDAVLGHTLLGIAPHSIPKIFFFYYYYLFRFENKKICIYAAFTHSATARLHSDFPAHLTSERWTTL